MMSVIAGLIALGSFCMWASGLGRAPRMPKKGHGRKPRKATPVATGCYR
jgi:hypothetical protein